MRRNKDIVVLTGSDEFIAKLKPLLSLKKKSILKLTTIVSAPLNIKKSTAKGILGLEKTDWIVFSSKNAVRFFIKNVSHSTKSKIAAVGGETAKLTIRLFGRVDFVPLAFNMRELSHTVPGVKGRRILLFGAKNGRNAVLQLRKRGAIALNIELYSVKLEKTSNKELRALSSRIKAVLFASPSSVRSFVFQSGGYKYAHDILHNAAAFALGPSTGKALKKIGAKRIITTHQSTARGMATAFNKWNG
ncbi:MAG TPA: uroporphyrinogen-III synthase [Candidatus Paceibacterota bacterium]